MEAKKLDDRWVIEPPKGMSIFTAVEESKSILNNGEKGVLKFNDLEVPFYQDSKTEDVVRIYNLMHENRQLNFSR